MKRFFGRIFTVFLGNLFTVAVIAILFLLSIMVFSLAFSGNSNKKKLIKGSVLEISLNNSIIESDMEVAPSIFELDNNNKNYFVDYLRAIENAKTDDKIKGISLKLKSFKGGITKLEDLRKALLDFKSSGKFIYAYGAEVSQGAYYLMSVADSIFQHPMGGSELKGLNAEVTFYKNLGDKYGIDYQVIRHGDFKAAVEPYLRTDMSEENKLQLSTLMNDIWTPMAQEIAKSRSVSLEQVNLVTDSLSLFLADDARQVNMIDVVEYEPEYDQFIAGKINLEVDEDESFYKEYKKHSISLDDYLGNVKSKKGKDKIAVLYAAGTIKRGDGYEGIQSETYVNTIRKIKENDKIKAVVFRINSGGGDAYASDLILQELKELRKEKPLIVSFSDVAASGGYYIAMESDSIFAQPTTITGSIGVFGMIPNIKNLANNVGITVDGVKTHANSEILSGAVTPLSPYSKNKIQNLVVSVYDRFVNHVSNGRNLTYEQVDSIGGGRIWSGTKALELGLVDQLGNLNDAIKAAASKAGIDQADIRLSSYPIKNNSLEEILKQYQVGNVESAIEQELGTEYFELYNEVKMLKEQKGVQLKMPYSIKIE